MPEHWTTLTTRFTDEKQCLATFLAWQAAEVLSAAKPANLINIFDKPLPCGRNMYQLWQKHGKAILQTSSLRALDLQFHRGRLLVLVYHSQLVIEALQNPDARSALEMLGYPTDCLEASLRFLKERLGKMSFPHEVGFFLGYPAKDVLGFMGMNGLPLVKSGPWRMYGEVAESLTVLDVYRAARTALRKSLFIEKDPLSLVEGR
ncbi:MAG TPA: DUF3793 family protein [Desulfuromonadales bacterium]|nr:DUF3793 family protein [Desulfuromonadales bacterium]